MSREIIETCMKELNYINGLVDGAYLVRDDASAISYVFNEAVSTSISIVIDNIKKLSDLIGIDKK